MNPSPRRHPLQSKTVRASLLSCLCLLQPALGQVAPASTKADPAPASAGDRPSPSRRDVETLAAGSPGSRSETVELSPFVVQAEQGWQATETVAGTRLKTELRDVPDQLEVFTKEFMENLAVNTSDEATLYSMNADARADVLTDTDSPELSVANLSITPNIRGMAQTQHSRRFFYTPFPIDSYNTDSFTIASGANPVLVGAGLGAGFIDASASNATMRSQTMLKLQYSSEDSKRTQLNINRVIIPNKLAFRVDGPRTRA